MTVLAKLRRIGRPISMTLAVVGVLVAGASFAAHAGAKAGSSEHCESMSQDIESQLDVAEDLHSSGDPSGAHAPDGSCCETECHCPSIAGTHALCPVTMKIFDLPRLAPEYPSAPVLQGRRPDELLRPPI